MDLMDLWSNYFWIIMEGIAALGIVSASFYTSGNSNKMRRIGFTLVFIAGFFAIPVMIHKEMYLFLTMELWYGVVAIRGFINNYQD